VRTTSIDSITFFRNPKKKESTQKKGPILNCLLQDLLTVMTSGSIPSVNHGIPNPRVLESSVEEDLPLYFNTVCCRTLVDDPDVVLLLF